MSFDAETLFRLLPAFHRIRDAELAAALGLLTPAEAAELTALETAPGLTVPQQLRLNVLRDQATRGPLKALMMTLADEIAVMEENVEQLYDDLFIETCADWAIPYIGDLIGYEPLHARGRARGLARAEVAHTIALRRRKGTAAVLEQLARDVTGWGARAVEYFQHLGTTQYMNHLRPFNHYAPDLRRWEPLARIGGAFESLAHTVDVRRIENARGRFNVPNVGIFLWRIGAYRHTRSPAVRVDDRRYLMSPLGHPLQLYTNPVAEGEITHLAEPINVPDPIRRRVLRARKQLYYGTRTDAVAPVDNADPSVVLYVDDAEVPRDAVVVCDLSDSGAVWAHEAPAARYAIDPVLGRVAVAPDLPVPDRVDVTYHYGFSDDTGGGEYDREPPIDAPGTPVLRVPDDHPTIQAALAALGGDGVVEITDSGRYAETPVVVVRPDAQVTLRAAERCRPTLVLGGEFSISGGPHSGVTLDGLLVTGDLLRVAAAPANGLARLRLSHVTLVPGQGLDGLGEPVAPGVPSLIVETAGVAVELERAITGPLRVVEDATLAASDSIVDACGSQWPAYTEPDGAGPGGELSLEACTVIGKVNVIAVGLISNCLMLARGAAGDPVPPVHAVRRQTGCVRFSFLPLDSLVPRRHRCQPTEDDPGVAPRLTTLRYGSAAYGQLAPTTPDAIRRGADDESEMGAFHALFPAQRESNLRVRLQEFLRVGLAAGIFYET